MKSKEEKRTRKTLFIYIVISIITLWALTWLISCERDPVIVQDVESNSVITYVVEPKGFPGVGEYTYYCEYIDPELEKPQRVILNKFNTPWQHDVVAKGDIEQYHCYFRYYGYIVVDTNYGEYGIAIACLNSDFAQEPNLWALNFSLDVDFLLNNEIVPDSCQASSSFGGFLYPRKDGRDWNYARNFYFSKETRDYYIEQRRENYNEEDWSHHIYVILERWFDEDGECMGLRVKKD